MKFCVGTGHDRAQGETDKDSDKDRESFVNCGSFSRVLLTIRR